MELVLYNYLLFIFIYCRNFLYFESLFDLIIFVTDLLSHNINNILLYFIVKLIIFNIQSFYLRNESKI